MTAIHEPRMTQMIRPQMARMTRMGEGDGRVFRGQSSPEKYLRHLWSIHPCHPW